MVALTSLSMSAQPQLRLPSIFGDNMVLQADTLVKVWGWCNPGSEVSVSASWGETAKTKADGCARWELLLKTPKSSDKEHSIVVTGRSRSIKISNILVGQLWICSGQSNMEWGARKGIIDASEELPKETSKTLRLFTVSKKSSHYPQEDIDGRWILCQDPAAMDFSATGYFFGKSLSQALDQPVGLINISWGGSPVEAWTPKSVLSKDHPMLANWPKRSYAKKKGWEIGGMYNGMVYPLRFMTVSGVIWYQGEANVRNATLYEEEFTSMIDGWRKGFKSDLPFIFVQLPPLVRENIEILREQQEKVYRSESNVGMICISDCVDDTTSVHPLYKRVVGERLSRYAQGMVYDANLKYKPVMADSLVVKGKRAVVYLKDAEGTVTCRGGKISHLEIAGKDNVFYPADGIVDNKNSSIVVWSNRVKSPMHVRYCYRQVSSGNLYDCAGMPLPPFSLSLNIPVVNDGKAFVAVGREMVVKTLRVGETYYSNRSLKISQLPDRLVGWNLLSLPGGKGNIRNCKVTVPEACTVYVFATKSDATNNELAGWKLCPEYVLKHTTSQEGRYSTLTAYSKNVVAGEVIDLSVVTAYSGAMLVTDKNIIIKK